MFEWIRRILTPGRLSGRIAPGLSPQALDAAVGQSREAITIKREAKEFGNAAGVGLHIGRELYRVGEFDLAGGFLEGAAADYLQDSVAVSMGPAATGAAVESALLNIAEAQYWLGCSQSELGRYREAEANLRNAARKFESSHVEKRAGDAYLMWGAALKYRGLHAEDNRLLEKSLERFHSATQRYEDAIQYREVGGELGIGQVFLSSAPVLLALGRVDEIISAHPRARDIFGRHGTAQQREWCENQYRHALECARSAATKA